MVNPKDTNTREHIVTLKGANFIGNMVNLKGVNP